MGICESRDTLALPVTCFTLGERAPHTYWTGSWEGPRVGVCPLEDRKISCLWEIKPWCLGQPAQSIVTKLILTYWYGM